MEKRVKIEIIKTDNDSRLLEVLTDDMAWRGRPKGRFECHDSPWPISEQFKPYYIYVFSDDYIDNENWCLCLDEIEEHPESAIVKQHLPFSCGGCRKIIATNDPELNADGVLELSESFIDTFARSGCVKEAIVTYDENMIPKKAFRNYIDIEL